MSANEPRLYMAATGHVYAGLCPDATQPAARDPECAACRLLIAGPSVEALMPRVWALAVAHAEYVSAPTAEKERARKEAIRAIKEYARRLEGTAGVEGSKS